MIVFNVLAIVQVVILVAFWGIIYFFHWIFGAKHGIFMVGGGGELGIIVQALVSSYLLAFCDIKGVKGRLFWVPSWILLALAVLLFSNVAEIKNPIIYQVLAGLVFILYYFLNNLEIRSDWAKAKASLELLKEGPHEDEDFWRIASHAYYKPSWFYFTFPTIWKFFFIGTGLSGDEMLQHYREFIHLINQRDNFPLEQEYIQYLKDFEVTLNQVSVWKDISGKKKKLEDLAEIIDRKN